MGKAKEKVKDVVWNYTGEDASGQRGVHSSSWLTYLVTALCATVALLTHNIDANVWLGAITLDGIAYKVGRGLKR